jgi:chemotaxis methyl-accepting protein methylase
MDWVIEMKMKNILKFIVKNVIIYVNSQEQKEILLNFNFNL